MFATSRSTFERLRAFASAVMFGGVAVLAACGSSTVEGPATCDSAKCATGNKCLPLNSEVKCRKTCSSNADPATSCPFGYTCTDTLTGVEPFCVQDTAKRDDGTPLEKKPNGQWGARCQANKGISNPDCDTEQGFFCMGSTPTDGNAYCTRYDCTADTDCGAGFWCGKVNQTPNVETAKRSTYGEVQNVCLRRKYCATCVVDLDCPPIDGKNQHCVDAADATRFCAPECENTTTCPNEARCADVGLGVNVCYPRANVCAGDGSLCSPCRVDTDCGEDGVCIKGEYTTEKMCAKKVAACADCPESFADANKKVTCIEKSDTSPYNFCAGVYNIGGKPGDLGCWTPNR
jgi:hypothetical protein